MNDISLYLHFVLNAVLGRLREADALMLMHGSAIRRVAEFLRYRHPVERMTLHRGVLIENEFDASGREFVSWSENADVAEWFADPRSMMNEYVMGVRPKSVGFLLTSDDEHCVLFHHAWAEQIADLPSLALRHPDMGIEGARQLEWSLQTQYEVITEPPSDWRRIWGERRAFDVSRDSLDNKLAPPWLRHVEQCNDCGEVVAGAHGACPGVPGGFSDDEVQS